MDYAQTLATLKNFGSSAPTEPAPQLSSGDLLQNRLNAARKRLEDKERQSLDGAAANAGRYAQQRQLQKNSNADLGTDSDVVRALTGGATRGFGTVAEGVGYASGQLAGDNPISSGLEAIGQGITQAGQQMLDTRNVDTLNAIRDTQISGNILTGENVSFGDNPSFKGLMSQLLPTLSEMAPQMAAMLVGGVPGYVASVGAGVAQAGISQGNQNFENIMAKSEKEMYQYSDAYSRLRAQNPNISHDDAKREIADTGKANAFVAAGAVGGVGGALTRFLWKGPSLAVQNARKAATSGDALKAAASAAKPPNSSVLKGVAKGGAVGFVEEGSEEAAEGIISTAAVNRAVGASETLGEGSAGDFILGGLAGGTTTAAANAKGAVEQKLVNKSGEIQQAQKESAQQKVVERNQVKEIAQAIDDGKVDKLIDSGQYDTDKIAAALVTKTTNKESSTEEKQSANLALAKLETATRSKLNALTADADTDTESSEIALIKQRIEKSEALLAKDDTTESLRAIATKALAKQRADLQVLENEQDTASALNPEQRKTEIAALQKTLSRIESSNEIVNQAVRESTPDTTAADVQTVTDTKASTEQRKQAADQVIVKAATDADQVSDNDLKTLYSSGALDKDQELAVQAAINIRESANDNARLQELKGVGTSDGKALGFVSLNDYAKRIERAITARRPDAAQEQLFKLDGYQRLINNKATAAQEAQALANSTGKQHKIVPSKNGQWTVSPYTVSDKGLAFSDKQLKAQGGVFFSKQRSSSVDYEQAIKDEAAFIGQHRDLLAYQIQAAVDSPITPASGSSAPKTAQKSSQSPKTASAKKPTKSAKPTKPVTAPVDQNLASQVDSAEFAATEFDESSFTGTPPAANEPNSVSDTPIDTTALNQQLRSAYARMGALQESTEPDTDALTQVQAEIKETSETLFADEPAMTQLVDMINTVDGAPFKNVARWAYTNAQKDIKALLKELSKTNSFEKANNVNFALGYADNQPVQDNDTAGYSFTTQRVSVLPVKRNRSVRRTAEDIAHEILHPITGDLIEKDSAFKAEIERLQQVMIDWVDNNPDTVKDLIDQKQWSPRLYNYAAGIDNDTGAHELITTALSSAEVKAMLAQVPDADGSKATVLESLREAILSFVQKVFGITPAQVTVLDGVLNLVDTAIKADTPAALAPAESVTPTLTPTVTETASDDALVTEFAIQQRREQEQQVKDGKIPFYTFEQDGDVEAQHTGPFKESDAKIGNLLRAHFTPRRNSPMNYSDRFISDVFLNDAYKDLSTLSQYLNDADNDIADFTDKGDPEAFRRVLKEHHNRWIEALKSETKTKQGRYRTENPISYLAVEGELDENALSAIAMGTFNYLSEKGNTLYANYSDSMIRGVLGLDRGTEVTPQLRQAGATKGMREAEVQRQIGQQIAQLLGLQLNDTAPANEAALVYSALGAHGLTLILRDGYYQRNEYSGLDVRPTGIKLKEFLQRENQFPNEAILGNREQLLAYLKTTSLDPVEQRRFYQEAFSRHTFIRNNRTAQSDVPAMIKKMYSEKSLQKGKKYSNTEFNDAVNATASFTEEQKQRLIDVYPAYKNPRTRDKLVGPDMSRLLQATKGSRAFMSSLLKHEPTTTLPTTDVKKAGFKDTTKNNTELGISEQQRKALDEIAKKPITLNQGLMGTDPDNPGILIRIDQVDDLFYEQINGRVEGTVPAHVDHLETIEAQNEGLAREAHLAFQHVYEVLEGDSTKPWYKKYAVWSNERMGIDSQGFNSLSNKSHRGLESQESWKFTVDPTKNDQNHVAFKYAIVQSLGAGVDKMSPASALAAYNNMMQDPEIQEAVVLMDSMRNDPQYVLNATERARLVQIITKHVGTGEGSQMLRALNEISAFNAAKQNGTTFETDISAEVDGRASGAALTMVQLGMNADAWETHLEMAGIFTVGSRFTNAGDSIEETQTDVYKETVRMAVAAQAEKETDLRAAAESGDKKAKSLYQLFLNQQRLVNNIMGTLVEGDGSVTSAARKAVKEAVTANVFGASNSTMANTLSADFVDAFREKLVKLEVAKDQAGIDELVGNLNILLPAKFRLTNNNPSEVPLSVKQIQALSNAITYTFAEATGKAVNELFADSRQVASAAVENLSMIQKLYKALFEAESRRVLNEQNAEAEAQNDSIARPTIQYGRFSEDKKTRLSPKIQYQPALTKEQTRAIHDKIQAAFPYIQSPTSTTENARDKGLSAFSSGTVPKLETDALTGAPYDDSDGNGSYYTSTRSYIQLNNPLKAQTATPGAENNRKFIKAEGVLIDYLETGIGGLSKPEHAQDALVALQTMINHDIINAHDGFTAGGAQMGAVGQSANQAFFDTVSNYSTTAELAKTIMQTLDNFDDLSLEYGADPQFVKDKFAALPIENVEGVMVTTSKSPTEVAYKYLLLADVAERRRLEALSQVSIVDQYYYPGSAYTVSDEQRAALAKRAKSSDLLGQISADRLTGAEPFPDSTAEEGVAQKAWLARGVPETTNTETPTNIVDKDTGVSQSVKPLNKKASLSRLNAINAALGKTNGRLVPALQLTLKDPATLQFYQDQLTDSNSRIMDVIPENKNARLVQWRKAYLAGTPTEKGLGTLYGPGTGKSNPQTQFTSSEIFDALDKQTLPSAEATRLRDILTGTVGKLFTNVTGLPGLSTNNMGQTAEELAAAYVVNQVDTIGSGIEQAGIQLTRAQAFVASQIEIAMNESLASQTLADNSIVKLYNRTKKQLNPDGRAFYLDANGEQASDAEWNAATDVEKAQAKATYDLMFTLPETPESRSNQLSRFVALAMVYQPLRAQIDGLGNEITNIPANEKIGARLERYFNSAISRMSNQLNGVSTRSSVTAQLEQLAKKLALNEHRRRIELNKESNKTVDFIDKTLGDAGEYAVSKIKAVAESDAITKHSNEMVKALGNIATTIAEDRVDEVVKLLEKWRDSERQNSRQSIVRAVINELRGETEENRKFFSLLAIANRIEQSRKEKKDVIQNEVLSNFLDSDDILDDEKAAITQLYLRSDMASLLNAGYSMERIHAMILNEADRKKQISALQDQLAQYVNGDAMLVNTTDMAYHMAHGRNVSLHLYQNAHLIVQNSMPGEFIDSESATATQAKQLVDELGSLLAVDQAPVKQLRDVRRVAARESARGVEDAFSYLVRMHKATLDDAQETLFAGQPALAIKGYVRENYTPYNTYEVADPVRGKELMAIGYELYGPLQRSSASTEAIAKNKNLPVEIRNAKQPALYILKGQGLPNYETAALLNTQQRARGSLDKDLIQVKALPNDPTLTGSHNATRATVASTRLRYQQKRINQLNAKTYRPSMQDATHDAPLFNPAGEARGFRYMASHQTRDEAMKRDNRFEAVLGATVGSTFNKQQSVKQNRAVIETIKEFYDAEAAGNPDAFVEISPTTTDQRMREAYTMLPEHTKGAIKELFGGNKMYVRKDLIDTVLGYRNLTTDEVLNKSKAKVDQMFNQQVIGDLLQGKRKVQIRRFHDHVTEIVRLYKDFIVVRNVSTLYNNIKSNMVLLFMYKVPLKDIVEGHRRAFQGLESWQETQKKLLRVQSKIDAAGPTDNVRHLKAKVRQYQFDLDRNPVKPLIDQGMFQTILDDVDLDKENTLYQTPTESFIDQQVNRLPDTVAKAGKIAFVSQDTALYKMLAKTTQMSDFVARFVLYESMHKSNQTAASNDKRTNDEIISEVRNAFVNYTNPTDQRLQYLNDIGLMLFTKYFLRTQKVIFNRIRKAPSRSMVAYLADRYVDNLDTILSSSAVTNVGNPFSLLDPSVVTEPVVINQALGLFD